MNHIETSRVEAHDNVCYRSYFFILKIYVTPFKMPNYPFGGNYPQVKNHCTRRTKPAFTKANIWVYEFLFFLHFGQFSFAFHQDKNSLIKYLRPLFMHMAND